MTCIDPPELNELQLAEYADGTAGEGVVIHVQRCPYCAARATQMARWQGGLQDRVWRATCPSAQELGEYHLGLLPGPQAVAAARHIVECSHCAAEIRQLRGFLRDVAAADQQADSASERLTGYLGRLVDVITGTMTMGPATVGLRGALREPLLVEANDVHIMLDAQPGPAGRGTLSGQILSEDADRWIGALIELWQRGQSARVTVVDEVGTFQFDGILAGPTELLLIAPVGDAVHIPDVDIQY